MLELKDFASEIEKALNGNSHGINFAVFADASEYEKAFKTRTSKTRYTNCLITAGASSIIPTQGLTVATQFATIEVCVQLPNPETDSEIISEHRAVLDEYFQQVRVDTITENNDDGTTKKYAVSAVYSFAATGDIMQRPDVGTSLTFKINAEWAYVENGLNSLNCVFELDGIVIPYSTASITKNPQVQADAFSNNMGRGTNINVSFVRSFDFKMPAQSSQDGNGIGELIIAQLLGNDLNTTHNLKVTLGGVQPKEYTVIFGDTNISVEGINNAGHDFALIEYIASGASNGNV